MEESWITVLPAILAVLVILTVTKVIGHTTKMVLWSATLAGLFFAIKFVI